MFDKMKAILEMKNKMQEMKQELESTDFQIQSPDGLVKVVMSGAQEVKEINILAELKEIEKSGLEKALKDTYNRAIKRSQEIAAGKMKDITGLNLPGLI